MEMDYRNIFYGDCIGTLEHIKKHINVLFGENLESVENFLKSFCAELRLSNISNANKKIILSYLLCNKDYQETHYWDSTTQKLTYEEWQNEQKQTTLECISILTKANERIEAKQNQSVILEDEESFSKIGNCYKYLREINLESTILDKQELYENYENIVCSETLKLTKKISTNN